ncbi:MAG: hypothetical protein IJR31_06165 [Lachnospiraceae bacterium]|nr:hypothetical protein [Lachnospiraceae bacterium]
MTYKKVIGTQQERPLEIDTESSQTVVYIRRDIQRVEVESEGETSEVWEYEEAEMTHEEFKWYQKELDSPSLDIITQMVNDVAADQALSEITREENHEEQMQMLNDIQADIALIGE